MADTVTPPPSGAADTGTANNEPGEQQTFSVTREDWDKQQRQLNSLAAALRKQQQAAPVPPPQVEPEADEPKSQRARLEALQAEMRKDKERLEKKARRNGIREAIAQNGITDPEAVEILFDHVESRHGSKIQIADEDQVSVLDELGDSKTVAALIGDILKSPKGRFFKPERIPGPNTRAGRGNSSSIPGQKNVMEMSPTELAALPAEQRAALFRQAAQG